MQFLVVSVSIRVCDWMSRVKRPHQHIIGYFRDESFQSITCTGTGNLTENNHETAHKNNTKYCNTIKVAPLQHNTKHSKETWDKKNNRAEPSEVALWYPTRKHIRSTLLVTFKTSSQETDWVYSFNPEAQMGHKPALGVHTCISTQHWGFFENERFQSHLSAECWKPQSDHGSQVSTSCWHPLLTQTNNDRINYYTKLHSHVYV